jgi:DNA-binding LacI/PurR family transcriptional regulator
MATTNIKDVADRAGASIASVSRALSGGPGVSEDMRRRVMLAARELNYRPDQVARSMRRRKSNLIGLCVTSIENRFFSEVAHAAEQAALHHGYSLLTVSTDERIDREAASVAVLQQQLVAGIILAPAPGDAAAHAFLQSYQSPIVLIDRDLEDSPYHAVVANDQEAVRECVGWMIDQGRRRIGVIRGLDDLTATRDRLEGYYQALTDAELQIHPELVLPGYSTVEGGYKATYDLMVRANPPDGIFVHNNVMLTGALLALQDMGIRWPTEVEVTGFGAFKTALLYQPPLTLIAQPTYEMAERAMSLLIDNINGRQGERSRKVVLQNRLITRDDWVTKKGERNAWMRRQPAMDGMTTHFVDQVTSINGSWNANRGRG